MKIMMKRIIFTKIVIMIQKAWEFVQMARLFYEERKVLNSIKHIQMNIASFEQKYENIQVKVTENMEMILTKLNEIQVITARLEIKHEAIERTIKETPKT